jgi:hypothetical protein
VAYACEIRHFAHGGVPPGLSIKNPQSKIENPTHFPHPATGVIGCSQLW